MSQCSWHLHSSGGNSRKQALVVQSDKCYHRRNEYASGEHRTGGPEGKGNCIGFLGKRDEQYREER